VLPPSAPADKTLARNVVDLPVPASRGVSLEITRAPNWTICFGSRTIDASYEVAPDSALYG
jgi:hypothetical protein